MTGLTIFFMKGVRVMNAETIQLLQGNTYKNFAKYVSLNVISMIGLSLYVLADTYFIANGIGKDGLIALNLVLPVYNGVLNAIGLLIATGVGTIYSIYVGKQEHRHGNEVFTQVIFISLLISLVLTLIGVVFSENIVKLLGASDRLAPLAKDYIKTIFFFSSAFILNNIMVCMIRNDGNPKLAMTAMLTGSFSNIILDYIFIFPLRMGMFGAALATGISPVLSLLVLSLHVITKKNNFKIVKCRIRPYELLTVTVTGIPAFITEFSCGIVILIFNLVIIKIVGDIGVAAYGIIANISLMFTAIFTGIGQGIQPIISTNFGANKTENTIKALRYGSILALALGIVFYLICILFPEPIISAFNSENNVRLFDITKNGMRLYFSAFILMGTNIVMITFFASITKSKPSFILSILRGVALIIAIILILPNLIGLNGVWLTIPITEMITFILGVWLTRSSSI